MTGVQTCALPISDSDAAVVVGMVPMERAEPPLYGPEMRLVPEDGLPEAKPRPDSKRAAQQLVR